MKKVTCLAAAALAGVSIMATPLRTMAAGPMQVSSTNDGVKIFAGGVPCAEIDSLKDFLENCQPGNMQIITIPCLPGNWPGAGSPEADQPGVDTPETEQPEVGAPEGENIAWGQKTPEQVMEGWMNSAGHRANILNEKYTSIGVGYYQNAAGRNYWSQLFTY